MTLVNSGLKGLNPHDIFKHYFTSLNNDFISYTLEFWNEFFKGTFLIIATHFFSFATHFKSSSLQVENCDSHSRIEGDNGKFRFERVTREVSINWPHCTFIHIKLWVAGARQTSIE